MPLTKGEIVALLKDEEHQQTLFDKADFVRKQYVGDEVHLRGLIEFSKSCCFHRVVWVLVQSP